MWEAEKAIDKFIDTLIHSGFETGKVIFGSSGPLKRGISSFLKQDSRIEDIIEETYWDTSHTCYYLKV